MSDTDLELLARYSRDRADEAFTELVRRHLDLVHSAALRQVRSPQLAEEVAQSTFLKLAQHARQLAPDTILSAWLYQVTRREAIDVVRREARRQLREQIATEMNAMNATAADWTHIEPLLDEAMHALDETDRAAVLLRYFENKSLREVGQALGASENAAQKRLTRAVERLREFFAKQGIGVSASGLAVFISANAVQAAPVGLAVAISTAAALGATTIITAATATSKAIAMTTIQKTLLTSAFVALASITLYEARQASILRGQLTDFQSQIETKLEELTQDRDGARSELAVLRRDIDQRNRATDELLKLRSEVARLKADASALARLNLDSGDERSLSEAVVWQQRVKQLKQHVTRNPAAATPELQLATDQDWLSAARKSLESEVDYRRAISQVRSATESRFSSMLQAALSKFKKASDSQFPTDLRQLLPYLDPPVDEGMLSRWEILPATRIKNIGVGGDSVITQKEPTDEVFDMRHVIGPNGSGSTDFLYSNVQTALRPVWEAFKLAHNGQDADDTTQLLPYATTPEQRTALEKMILRETATK